VHAIAVVVCSRQGLYSDVIVLDAAALGVEIERGDFVRRGSIGGVFAELHRNEGWAGCEWGIRR
jgi:hypothetical protein